MRNAKLLLLIGLSAVCSVGCAIQTQIGAKAPEYDDSDYAYYDKPFGTSPDYRDASSAGPVAVAKANPTIAAGKADREKADREKAEREPAKKYDDSTAVAEGAGVPARLPAKAGAFATHFQTVLSTPATK
jgi:hypothetical protein